MNEWLDSQKKTNGNFRQLLQERIEKTNPRRELSAEESKRLNKLEGIADKLKRGENVQNRQLQTWLSEDEYEQFEYEWQEQLELRSELKDKQQDKPQAVELWNYFSSVIDWTQAIFPKYRKEMKGIDWGYLYNDFKDETLDPNKL